MTSSRSRRMVCGLAAAAALAPLSLYGQTNNTGRVQGTVFDSTRALPLAAASVEMIEVGDPSRMWRATTNARGEFTFDSLAAGSYRGDLAPASRFARGESALARCESWQRQARKGAIERSVETDVGEAHLR